MNELSPSVGTAPSGGLADASDRTPNRKSITSRARRALKTILPGATGLGLFALSWQLLAAHYAVRTAGAFPSIGAIWSELSGNVSTYGIDAAHTLEEVTIGLGVSFVVAFTVAIVMTHVPIIERVVMPLAVILNVTPIVAIAPGLTLLLGLGMSPRYVVTALIVFFPLLINSLVGLGSVDPEALDLFQTMHASKTEVLVHLRLPSSLPFLFVAARICLPLATVGAVVAEFSTSGPGTGLGSAIAVAVASDSVPTVYAAIFCLAVMGLALTVIVTVAERHLLAWHPSSRLTTRER
jgi:NitT/TauT family transport system permease protein